MGLLTLGVFKACLRECLINFDSFSTVGFVGLDFLLSFFFFFLVISSSELSLEEPLDEDDEDDDVAWTGSPFGLNPFKGEFLTGEP